MKPYPHIKGPSKAPQQTCLALGPDEAERIDAISGHLPLL